MQPVVNLGISGKGSAEQFALQLLKFELIFAQRIVRECVGVLENELLILPGEIFHGDRTICREIAQRPVTIALEVGAAFAQFLPSRNRSRLTQIHMRLITRVDAWIAEIADATARRKRRPA